MVWPLNYNNKKYLKNNLYLFDKCNLYLGFRYKGI